MNLSLSFRFPWSDTRSDKGWSIFGPHDMYTWLYCPFMPLCLASNFRFFAFWSLASLSFNILWMTHFALAKCTHAYVGKHTCHLVTLLHFCASLASSLYQTSITTFPKHVCKLSCTISVRLTSLLTPACLESWSTNRRTGSEARFTCQADVILLSVGAGSLEKNVSLIKCQTIATRWWLVFFPCSYKRVKIDAEWSRYTIRQNSVQFYSTRSSNLWILIAILDPYLFFIDQSRM